MDTASEIKFRGDVTESIAKEPGLGWGDGLLSILFTFEKTGFKRGML